MKLKKVMDLDNVVGKSKTLTKFDAWFFFMKLENQEESFNVVAFWGFFLHCIALHCIYYILYIIFYVFYLVLTLQYFHRHPECYLKVQ